MNQYRQFKSRLQEEGFRNKIRWTFHTAYLLIFIFVYIPSYEVHFPLVFPELFTRDVFEYSLVTFYVYSIYLFVRKYDVRAKLPILTLILLVMLISLIGMAYFKNLYQIDIRTQIFKDDYIWNKSFSLFSVFNDFLQYIGFAALLSLMFLFVDNLNYFFSNDYDEMKKALNEAQNQLLRQQLSPHFLFNALNSTYSMALNNHPDTAVTILKLSGMMRYLTDEVQVRAIPLARELKFMQKYIDIEKVRFGEKADIHLEIKGSAEGKFIEPLLLISLVENAFKHGFYTNRKDAFVHVILDVGDQELSLNVSNRLVETNKLQNIREGKGLVNLRKRLALAYDGKFELKLSTTNQIYSALMKLKFN